MTVQPTRDQLRALANAATPGPWSYPGEILGLPCSTVFAGDPKRTHAAYVAAMGPHDGEFIAAARNALPALLDALDQAEAEVKRLSWKCGHLADKYTQDTDELRQEAGQAEARIQAVRELHHHDVFRGHLDNGCAICGHDWPCPTIRALDGEQ